MALREGKTRRVDYVVIDEFHYYADRERGVAWQIPLLVARSARVPAHERDARADRASSRRRSRSSPARPTVTVRSARPPGAARLRVPRDAAPRDDRSISSSSGRVARLPRQLHPARAPPRGAEPDEHRLLHQGGEEARSPRRSHGVRFDTPYGKEVQRFLAPRHRPPPRRAPAEVPPARREARAEGPAQDHQRHRHARRRRQHPDPHGALHAALQVRRREDGASSACATSSRSPGARGARASTTSGSVVAQAPEHVIENLRLEAKAGGDPVKKQDASCARSRPRRGYVHWDRATFDRLVAAHARAARLALPGLARHAAQRARAPEDGGCMAMARLIHGSPRAARAEARSSGATALHDVPVARSTRASSRSDAGTARASRVNADLQEDFSLNHALSLYLVDTLDALDRESPTYALDVLTLVESILENPDFVLRQQLDVLKTREAGRAEGGRRRVRASASPSSRSSSTPSRTAEFIYDTFNAFARHAPLGAGRRTSAPKSIAREMFERFMRLQRVRARVRARARRGHAAPLPDRRLQGARPDACPARAKTTEVDEIVTLLRRDRARRSTRACSTSGRSSARPRRRRRHERRARGPGRGGHHVNAEGAHGARAQRAVRVRPRARASRLRGGGGDARRRRTWKPETLEAALAPFWAEHAALRTDAHARSPEHTRDRLDGGGRMARRAGPGGRRRGERLGGVRDDRSRAIEGGGAAGGDARADRNLAAS